MKLLIATHNPGKKREFAELLRGLDLEFCTLADLGEQKTVEETGGTYAENALLKARGYAVMTGLTTLADDSGLEVDALGGAPGVLSARYAGEDASDEARYRLLLHNLEGVPEGLRTARFRCVIAIAWPDGRAELAEGAIEGRITREPVGAQGFGYDPVFWVPEQGKTMAELAPEVKNSISHRARAATAAAGILRRYLRSA